MERSALEGRNLPENDRERKTDRMARSRYKDVVWKNPETVFSSGLRRNFEKGLTDFCFRCILLIAN